MPLFSKVVRQPSPATKARELQLFVREQVSQGLDHDVREILRTLFLEAAPALNCSMAERSVDVLQLQQELALYKRLAERSPASVTARVS